MHDALLIPWIQACIDAGKYFIEDHAMERHPVQEGFTPRQAIESIANATLVSHREADCVCCLDGECSGLEIRSEFHGRHIHTVINYDRLSNILIITMYRPSVEQWLTPTTRR